MTPTWQEFMAGAVTLGILAIVGALLLTGQAVPELIAAPLTMAIGYIFGSRTSKPEAQG